MISIIVCVDLNRAIGYQNKLLARISADLKQFRELTTHHKIVMGYNTAISLPGPLPDRENIVITNNHKNDLPAGFDTSWNIEDIVHRYEFSEEEIFIVGGQSIYEYFLPFSLKVYLTEINKKFENVDTFFPQFNEKERWYPAKIGDLQHDDKTNLDFKFYEFISRREQIYGNFN